MPGVLDFDGYEQTIQPSSDSQSMRRVFEKDVVYRVEVTRMPGSEASTFYPAVRAATHRRDCRRPRSSRHCGTAAIAAIVGIHVNSDDVPVNVVIAQYETSRSDDLEAMYRAVMQERLEPCPR